MQYSTVQHSTAQYSTVQHSTAQYSTAQYTTLHYTTVQYSTVQYSSVQYSTVQYWYKNGTSYIRYAVLQQQYYGLLPYLDGVLHLLADVRADPHPRESLVKLCPRSFSDELHLSSVSDRPRGEE